MQNQPKPTQTNPNQPKPTQTNPNQPTNQPTNLSPMFGGWVGWFPLPFYSNQPTHQTTIHPTHPTHPTHQTTDPNKSPSDSDPLGNSLTLQIYGNCSLIWWMSTTVEAQPANT